MKQAQEQDIKMFPFLAFALVLKLNFANDEIQRKCNFSRLLLCLSLRR